MTPLKPDFIVLYKIDSDDYEDSHTQGSKFFATSKDAKKEFSRLKTGGIFYKIIIRREPYKQLCARLLNGEGYVSAREELGRFDPDGRYRFIPVE